MAKPSHMGGDAEHSKWFLTSGIQAETFQGPHDLFAIMRVD